MSTTASTRGGAHGGRLAGVRDECVAETVHRSDVSLLVPARAECLAQVGHEPGERRFTHEGVGPEMLVNLGLREGPGALGHQQREEFVDLRRQMHLSLTLDNCRRSLSRVNGPKVVEDLMVTHAFCGAPFYA